MDGSAPKEAYADLAAQQWFVYSVLEEACERHRSHPVAGAFVHDELARRPAIEEDLVALWGPGWAEAVSALPTTTTYVTRLREVAHEDPTAFVAHHYTRYLGDLSGGVHIGRAIDRSYGFGGGPGVRFYAFDAIDDLDAFKDRYRHALDAAAWTAEQKDALVDEVRLAYRLNQAVLAELEARHGGRAT
jgi:heme oxygenase